MQNPDVQQGSQQNHPQQANDQPSTQTIPSPQSQVIQPNLDSQQPMVQPSMPSEVTQTPSSQKYAVPREKTEQKPKEETKPQSGLEILEQESGIFIEQSFELCYGGETKYEVYGLDNNGVKKGTIIFKCLGKSECLARTCLSGRCRPFKIDISSLHRGEEDVYESFLDLERPCKYTCLCCNRPSALVMLAEGGRSEYIGKIVDPYTCCDMDLQIFDKENDYKYYIGGGCCQLGVLCPLPFNSCQTINFDVNSASSGYPLSNLQKKTQGCLKAAFSDVDSFALHFPHGCTSEEKALLMCAVLFLDHIYFEGRCG